MVKKVSQPAPLKSKKSPAATAPEPDSQRPFIQSRQMVGHDIKASDPVQDGQRPALATAMPPLAKRTIMPITVNDNSEPAEPEVSSQDQHAESTGFKSDAVPAADIAKKDEQAAPEKPAETKVPDEPKAATAEAFESSGGTASGAEVDTDRKPTPETEKAIKEAAEAATRERKLQNYIDNRHFFVPINAIAHKRSIRVSALLTIFTLLLAFLLIDLMLDSGIILLLQKIPHTHFFGLGD